jgi:GT2 family glycosyltransferase
MRPGEVAVAIPTYGRERVLTDTIDAVLRTSSAAEIVVLDQTLAHETDTTDKLASLAAQGRIRWIRLPEPSIPHAMNIALLEATRPVVLFLDDDIQPDPGLIAAHAESYDDPDVWAVAGQVLQPGETPVPPHSRYARQGLHAFLEFPFNSTESAWVDNVMAGNLSLRRQRALAVGGFDENFVGAAFRFETEFCRRLRRAGGRVLFQPRARIYHLRAPTGGTRAHGHHLTSPSAAHGVGDYYFAMRHGLTSESLAYMARRPLRKICARFYLRRPWWVPVGLVAEFRALRLAIRLRRRGPRYVAVPRTR